MMHIEEKCEAYEFHEGIKTKLEKTFNLEYFNENKGCVKIIGWNADLNDVQNFITKLYENKELKNESKT